MVNKDPKKKFIPYGKQNITKDDINSVVKVLNSPFLTQGEEVPHFEEALTKKVDAKYGVAVNSATSALHIACLALGLSEADIVWTSAITFVASANCAKFCGAIVDFVDIDLNTGNLSIPLLEEKLVEAKLNNKLPKILIPVHLAGSSCEMEQISKLSKEYGFAVLEDASHALGGKYRGGYVGNCKFSDITVFSFHPVKIITTGEGGIATTNNLDLFKKMSQYRSHGIVRENNQLQFLKNIPWGYEQITLGFNYRMNDIEAALGKSQLNRLDEIIKTRNKLALRYRSKLSKDAFYILKVPKEVISSYHLAVLRFLNCSELQHQEVFKFLRKQNIGVQLHYLPVHLHPFYRNLGFKEGDFPNAELYAKSSISLPLYVGLQNIEQDYVIEKLLQAYLKFF